MKSCVKKVAWNICRVRMVDVCQNMLFFGVQCAHWLGSLLADFSMCSGFCERLCVVNLTNKT